MSVMWHFEGSVGESERSERGIYLYCILFEWKGVGAEIIGSKSAL